MKNKNENIIDSSPDLKETEDKESEEWAQRYLDLEKQRNDNIDKLEEIDKELAILYKNLEK